jgi:hypothetical protein
MTSNFKTVKRNVVSKKIKLKGGVTMKILDVTDLQETETTTDLLLLRLPRKGGKATESKQKCPGGHGILPVKSPGSTVMVHMTLPLTTAKRNVVSKKIKLKGGVTIKTLGVTDLRETETTTVLLLLRLPRKGGKEIE